MLRISWLILYYLLNIPHYGIDIGTPDIPGGKKS